MPWVNYTNDFGNDASKILMLIFPLNLFPEN